MKLSRDLQNRILATPGVTVGGRSTAPQPMTSNPRVKQRLRKFVQPRCAIEMTIPLATQRGLNDREHWAKHHRRVQHERDVMTVWLTDKPPWQIGPECLVTLTRLGNRTLDDDNLAGAMKAVRDAVAEWLGCNDRDPSIQWRYAQEPGGPVGVRIRVETA